MLDSGFEYIIYKSRVYNEIQYLLPAIQCNNKKLNRGQLLWPAAWIRWAMMNVGEMVMM